LPATAFRPSDEALPGLPSMIQVCLPSASSHDVRSQVAKLRRDAVGPHTAVLDDVAVDAEQLVRRPLLRQFPDVCVIS
jgi:hypothetical protein